VSVRNLEQWVCWRSEARERDAKPTKVPYSPRSGSRARSDVPGTWGTLAQAEVAAEKERYDGIGFVFTEDDPFCGVDLDSCVDPETGEVEPWAMI
jgi:putative DNA primase/helicase